MSENDLVDYDALAAAEALRANPAKSGALSPINRSTGPRTPEGKAVSSGNARTHGCCSRQIVTKGESQENYDRLVATWFKKYAAGPLTNPYSANTEEDEFFIL